MLIAKDPGQVASATFRYSFYLLPIGMLAHQSGM
jgi:hypothetical protein